MNRKNESGFGAHALIALVAVVGIVGLSGYVVLQHANKNTTPPVVTLSATIPPTIRNKADLSATNKAVTAAGTQLQANMSTATLDATIKDLQ